MRLMVVNVCKFEKNLLTKNLKNFAIKTAPYIILKDVFNPFNSIFFTKMLSHKTRFDFDDGEQLFIQNNVNMSNSKPIVNMICSF